MQQQHPQMDEIFLQLQSKVDDVMSLLRIIERGPKAVDEESNNQEHDATEERNITQETFLVTKRQNPSAKLEGETRPVINVHQFTFMRQVEMTQDERSKARLERERVAQNFRKLGNSEYRKGNYESAINLYSRGIDNIKDSPILYTNRSLCYIKLGSFRRAIIDCDFVLNKLDEKNLRAWLYRGAAYDCMNDVANFENCIKYAKKNNSKQLAFIKEFLEKLENQKSSAVETK